MNRSADATPLLRIVPNGPGNPVPDAALVERARDGNQDASRALYDRHAPHVARVLTRILGSIPDVPDLLHDVFVAAFFQLQSPRFHW